MRRKEQEIKDKSIINEILNKAQICRIALCTNSSPYVIPINFIFKDDAIYFHSANEGKKIDIIKNNNNVCFQVETDVELIKSDKPCKCGMKYLCVIGFGKAFFVEKNEEKKKVLDAIMGKNTHKTDFEYPDEMIKKVAIIKIRIDEITAKQSEI